MKPKKQIGRLHQRSAGDFLCVSCFICYILVSSYCIRKAAADCLDVSKLIDLPENTPPGTLILNTTVNLLALKVTSSPNAGLIEILNSSLGLSVRLVRDLDAETISDTYMRFPVFCANTPVDVVTNTEIRLIIRDVNEYDPVFPKTHYTTSISESTDVQSTIYSFNNAENGAYDPDLTRDSIGYSTSENNTESYFYITPEGDVLLNKTLDFEKGQTRFTLTVEATEQGTIEHLSSLATLTIHVEDSDDVNPIFGSSFYTLSVPEGDYDGSRSYPTTPVISAQDGDSSLNQSIVFSIDQSTKALYGNLFSITSSRSLKILGRLSIGSYNINIRASQVDKPSARYAVAVTVINVTDVNDHAPVMGAASYDVTISEGLSQGFTFLTVTAEDQDMGLNAAFIFELDDPSNTFTVVTNGERGELQLEKPVDREDQEIYIFQVTAVETQTLERFRSQPSQVFVRVRDKNDNSPVFQKASYEFDVPRTALQGFQIGQVIASDEDVGLNGLVSYFLQPPPTWTALVIGNETGVLELDRDLALDDVGVHTVTVLASDRTDLPSETRSTVTQVKVTVLPVNDHAPVFVSPPKPVVLNLSETTAPGTEVLTVQAEDLDGDTIQYFFRAGSNDDGYFSIDSASGEITLTAQINLDANDLSVPRAPLSVVLLVEARDNLVHTTLLEITVKFGFVNEFAPVFQPTVTAVVFENATFGQKITTVTATDADSGPDGNIAYSLLASDVPPGLFFIQPDTGTINLACSGCLDYNDRNSYTLVIKAVDGGDPPRLALTTQPIQVTETVLVPPRFLRPQFQAEWQENKSPGYLLQLEADDSDTDQDQLTYTLSGVPSPPEAASKLRVFPNGSVYTLEPFDAEQISYVTADIKVSDGNGEDFAQLVLNITDVNDNNPVLNVTGASIFRVPENSKPRTLVTAVGATDSDISNEGFTFWLSGGGQGKFSVDQATGVITTSDLLDRREAASYNLTVHVSDYGAPPNIVEATVSVVVEDSNTGPVFLDQSGYQTVQFEFNVTEDLPVGQLLGSLKAFDPDSGSSGELSYRISSGDPSHTFSLDVSSGNLSLAAPLNYEKTPEYSLTATVSDNSYVPATETAAVNIRVLNVVEAPRWPLPLPVLYLTQTSACSPRLRAFSRELTSVSSQGDEAVEYRLQNSTDEFWINATSGLLHTNQSLEAREYVLTLLACSSGTDVCASANLIVVVRSDDILTFCPAFYRVEVNESSPVNFTVADLVINKPDSSLLYEITGGNEADKFGIHPQKGQVYVNALLDRETTEQYTLIVSATQKNSPSETAQAQIIVTLSDSPDSPPQFSSLTYQGEVSEGASRGSQVFLRGTSLPLELSVTDADLNPQFIFRIDEVTDTSNGSFSVDSNGQLFLTKKVDFESMSDSLNGQFDLNVTVSDGYFNASAVVSIIVKDVNDNWPVFDSGESIDLNVTEGGTVPRSVVTLLASDADQVDQGKLKYSLVVEEPPGTSSQFSVDSLTGQLRLERELDREGTSFYIINVTVADSNPTHRVTQTVRVTVTDINDNSPAFENRTYHLKLAEGDRGQGTELLLQADDADAGDNAELSFTFGVSNGPLNSFNLTKTARGVLLSTVESLDREALILDANDVFPLVIIATDKGDPQRTGEVSVMVTVEDINDNRPEFDLAGQPFYEITVQENVQNDTLLRVDPPVSVTDADERENGVPGIRFSLQPGPTENVTSFPFFVDPISGQLIIRYMEDGPILDRETKDSYQMELVATDEEGRGLNATAELVFRLTDVDDVAPRFTPESRARNNFSVPENSALGTLIGTVQAEDEDEIPSVVVYSLQGSRLFSIHHFNGDIKVAGNLDREKEDTHTLTVSACDLNGCDYQNVTVGVTDVNDNCPVWNDTTLTLQVIEDQGSGLYHGDIQANDPDLGQNGVVDFYLNDTTALRYIEVSPDGAVTLKSHIDDSDLPAGQSFLSFPVYAEDRGLPSCVTPGELRLVVKGVNDNPPQICFKGDCGVTEIKISVLDKSEADTVIGQVESRDVDTGSDGQVVFSFASDSEGVEKLFTINSAGIITLAQRVNLGDLRQNGQLGNSSDSDNNTLSVLLLATDRGDNSKSSNATLLVTVISSASDAPVFSKFSYQMDISESSSPGAQVGRVQATSPRTSQLTYSLATDGRTDPFTIEPLTGIIRTSSQLDRESREQYQFVVSAVDPFLPTFPTSAVVTVRVADTNDNKPVFADGYLSLSVLEGDVTEPVLATLEATDADTGVNGALQYQLVDGQSFGQFSLNATSGELKLIQPFDRETDPEFDLIVKVTDGGGLTADARVHIEVLDDNDNSPVFSKPVYDAVVIRSNSVRQKVTVVHATDKDAGANAQVVYTLEQSTESQAFTIDYLSGEIDAITSLPEDSYHLVVLASDQGNPSRESNASVRITVENNNTDVISAVTLSSAFASLFVGMGQGTQLQVNVTTENAARVEISEGNEGGWFELTPAGRILLQRNITGAAVFQLTLTATSVSGYKASQQLEVAAIPLSFDQPDYIVSVTENEATPQTLLDMSSYPETLGVPVVYSLTEPTDVFEVDASSGTLTLLKELDRETTAIHVLRVSLRLLHGVEGTPSATAGVVVTVKDENDNPPSFGSLGTALTLNLPENVTSPWPLAQISAFDPDEGLNSLIAYDITTGDTTSFSITRATGELKLSDSVYFDSLGVTLSRLTITATDRNGSSTGQAASLQVEIQVLKQIHQFTLMAPVSVSTFKDNQDFIIRELNNILGLSLFVDEVSVHSDSNGLDTSRADIVLHALDPRTNSSVSVDDIQRKITQEEDEISRLFQSYTEVPARRSADDDDLSAAAIALIVIGCIMFVVSLIAIAVVVQLWKRQKAYAEREETAVRARQRVEQRLANENAAKTTASVRASDDADQDFEMREMAACSPLSSQLWEHDKMFFFKPDTRKYGKNPALATHYKHSGSLEPVNGSSLPGPSGPTGTSSMDSGIDYSGEDWSRSSEEDPSPNLAMSKPRQEKHILKPDFERIPFVQGNSKSSVHNNNITGMNGVHIQPLTKARRSSREFLAEPLKTLASKHKVLDQTHGHVELDFVNPTYETNITNSAPHSSENDVLTRL